VNGYGLYTLFNKEIRRFLKVATQTLLAPIITVLLYLLVFSSVLAEHVETYPGVTYMEFLVPGLIMMSIIQNAFANSSSSLFQAKMTGSITFMLLAPLSSSEIYLAFVLAAIVRGLMVGLGVWVAAFFFVVLPIHNLFVLIGSAVISSAVLGGLGIIAALWAEKWDHIAAFLNFVILPLSFLSGVFYSVNELPPFWKAVSYYNPFFYMIDSFRYGFLGIADSALFVSLLTVSIFFVMISLLCLWLLHTGYKIRG
jgi:ABC-2 type transport system permease protein